MDFCWVLFNVLKMVYRKTVRYENFWDNFNIVKISSITYKVEMWKVRIFQSLLLV